MTAIAGALAQVLSAFGISASQMEEEDYGRFVIVMIPALSEIAYERTRRFGRITKDVLSS